MKNMTRFFGIALCLVLMLVVLPLISPNAEAANVKKTNFPDENLWNVLVDKGIITESGGSYTLDDSVTTLDLDSETTFVIIKDLRGIELFTNLATLNISNNELSVVDLSALTGLTELKAEHASIDEINLTKCTALTYLNLRDNHLGEVNISKNKHLNYLDVGNTTNDVNDPNRNHLKSLDVSVNIDLEYLFCEKNSLTALDVTMLGNLDYLNCAQNAITELKLTKNTALTRLDCSRNKLTELDISKTKLTGEAGYHGNDNTTNQADVGSQSSTVKVTMTETQADKFDKTVGNNSKVTVHVHNLKKVTVRATTAKNGYTRDECECGYYENKKTIKKVTTMKLSPSSFTYDGTVKKPAVIVQDEDGNDLVKGDDYTVSYASGRKAIGQYKVSIVLKGKYSGSKALTMTIRPPKTTVSKISAKKGGFALTWAKKSSKNTDGYVIQYATKSDFSNAKSVYVSGYKTVTKTVTGLKSGKTYYVRVAAYKVAQGEKVRSGWDSTSIKTK